MHRRLILRNHLTLFLTALAILLLVACGPTTVAVPPTRTAFVFPPTWTPIPPPTETSPLAPGPTAMTSVIPEPSPTARVLPNNGQYGAIAYICEKHGPFDSSEMKLCILSLDPASRGKPLRIDTPVLGTVTTEGSPSWSPDGTRIAFISQAFRRELLFVINPDGKGLNLLLDVPQGEYSILSPRWSPDSKRIAFICWHDSSQSRLCIIDNGSNSLIKANEQGRIDSAPAWSPDGTRIAVSMNNEIHLADVSDKTQIKLGESIAQGGLPAWSPDGKRIAFRYGLAIDVITVGSSAQRVRVADGAVLFFGHIWSPDGKQIAFVREVQNDKEVYLVNADGTGERRLTNNLNNNAQSDIQWSSDGTRILYVCNKSEIFNTDICTIRVDGPDQVQLTTNPLLDIEPVWRP